MNQQERCVWLIRQLLREQRWEDQIEIPDQFPQCQRLLRGLDVYKRQLLDEKRILHQNSMFQTQQELVKVHLAFDHPIDPAMFQDFEAVSYTHLIKERTGE